MIQRNGFSSRAAALAICVLMVCGRAGADDKSHRAAAEDLLKAAEVDKSFDTMIDQSIEMQVKANPMLGQLKPVLKKFMSKHLNYDLLKDEMIKMYQDEFTEEELKEIAAFYRTPTGQKSIKRMPALTQKGAELGMKRVQDNVGELQSMIVEHLNSKPVPDSPKP